MSTRKPHTLRDFLNEITIAQFEVVVIRRDAPPAVDLAHDLGRPHCANVAHVIQYAEVVRLNLEDHAGGLSTAIASVNSNVRKRIVRRELTLTVPDRAARIAHKQQHLSRLLQLHGCLC